MLKFLKMGMKVILILGSPLILGVFIAFIFSNKNSSQLSLNPVGGEPTIVAVSDSASAKEAAELLLKNISDNKNSTRALAEAVSYKLLEENPTGPVSVGGIKQLKAPEVSEIVQKFLEDGVTQFSYESLKPEIADTDLKISQDESPEALTKYIKEFLALTFAPLDKRMEQATNAADPQGAAGALIAVYEGRMADFLALETPKILTPLHKKQLALLGANKKIFELIRDYERDPLTAVLALNALNVVKAESVDVYREIAHIIAGNKSDL